MKHVRISLLDEAFVVLIAESEGQQYGLEVNRSGVKKYRAG
jgi:hypothetical protein